MKVTLKKFMIFNLQSHAVGEVVDLPLDENLQELVFSRRAEVVNQADLKILRNFRKVVLTSKGKI